MITFRIPLKIWEVEHNLNDYPKIQCFTLANEELDFFRMIYINKDKFLIEFRNEESGYVKLIKQ